MNHDESTQANAERWEAAQRRALIIERAILLTMLAIVLGMALLAR